MNLHYCEPRQLSILKILNENKDWVTGRYLANELGVTDRTIRNDIGIINYAIEPYSATVVSERGKGYRIKCKDNKLLMAVLSKESYFQSNNEKRVYNIFLQLLLSQEAVSLDELEDEYFVSRSTLEIDIKNIKELLKNVHPLVGMMRSSGSVKIIGTEVSIRFLINEIIMMNYDPKENILSLDGKFFKNETFFEIRQIVTEALNSKQLDLNDQNIADIVVYLYVTKKRVEQHHAFIGITEESIQFSNVIDEISKEMFLNVVNKDIIPEQTLDEEIRQLAIKLSFFNICQPLELNDKSIIGKLPKQIVEIVDLLIESISHDYHLDLTNDDELYMGLVFHIRALINRVKYQQTSDNPILEVIKKQYPFIFELSLNIYKIFKQIIDVELPESEVSYVAAHIAASIERLGLAYGKSKITVAVISHYVASYSKLLVSNIMNLCGSSVNVIGPFPSFKSKDLAEQNVTLVLTTCEVDERYKLSNVPTINISIEFPYEEQICIIKEIEKIKKQRLYAKDSIRENFIDNFNENLFFPELNLTKKEDILGLMSNSMFANGYVTNDFFKGVLEREKLASTGLNNMLAIPHPLQSCSSKNAIAVAILKNPIPWGVDKAQLIFMPGIKAEEKNQMREFFNFIEHYMTKQEFVDKLIQSKNYKEFIINIKNILQQGE